MIKVKRQAEIGSNRWGIYRNGKLVEGGFSTKRAAEDYADKEYRSPGGPYDAATATGMYDRYDG